MAFESIFYKAGDGIVLLGVRRTLYYPFLAPGWTDLRVAFFLSLTNDTDDDTITGLGETISGATVAPDRYWIGVKNVGVFPRTQITTFIGFTNSVPVNGSVETASDTVLSSSDGGLGTTNTNFWRPHNSTDANQSAMILDGFTVRAASPDGLQQHFPQDAVGAGGYAVLLGMRLLRDSGVSKRIKASFKTSTHSADMLYSDDPTKELIQDSIKSWPTGVIVLDSMADMIGAAPDGFFFYWPFSNSRLRIHGVGIMKAGSG